MSTVKVLFYRCELCSQVLGVPASVDDVPIVHMMCPTKLMMIVAEKGVLGLTSLRKLEQWPELRAIDLKYATTEG